jgi:sterol desaturase/sphingolipid hydroxylase (fatty acid hydroxylase superfamily)
MSSSGEEESPETESQRQLHHQQQQSRRTFWENVRNFWDSVRITLFVIGTSGIIFVAARNTITWHLQWLWGASGNYWQSVWEKIHELAGGNEIILAVWGSWIVSNFVFWAVNSFLIFLDVTGKPQVLLKYKIQEDKNVPVDTGRLLHAIRVVLFNQTIIGLPFIYVAYHGMRLRGCDFGPELPTFQWVVLELVVYMLVEEVFFYYTHRLLHHKRIYKYIHKTHHEWQASIGIIGIYAHPVEHVLSNLMPPVLGPLLMGSHIATAWLWFGLAFASTTVSHCGYHFPFLPSPEAHDYHHLKFTNNFGVMGVLDRLHGTDAQFRASKEYQRHFMVLGTTPVKQLIPDDPINGKTCMTKGKTAEKTEYSLPSSNQRIV